MVRSVLFLSWRLSYVPFPLLEFLASCRGSWITGCLGCSFEFEPRFSWTVIPFFFCLWVSSNWTKRRMIQDPVVLGWKVVFPSSKVATTSIIQTNLDCPNLVRPYLEYLQCYLSKGCSILSRYIQTVKHLMLIESIVVWNSFYSRMCPSSNKNEPPVHQCGKEFLFKLITSRHKPLH